ncbi:MAG: glycosyltransferase [Nitrososphaeria archaeon]
MRNVFCEGIRWKIWFGLSPHLTHSDRARPQEVPPRCGEIHSLAGLPRDLYEVIVVKSFHDAAIDGQLENWGVTSLSSESPGIGAKVCEALKVAEGDAISFLEDDDLFLPGKLKAVRRAFDMGIDYYHSGLPVIDEDGKELRHEVGPSFLVGEGEKTKYARASWSSTTSGTGPAQ